MPDESQTRAQLIDRQLARAGWGKGNRAMVEEFVVRGGAEMRDSGPPVRLPNEFADYVLFDGLHVPLAVAEAKRSSRSALEGERQAADYADSIEKSHGTKLFVFLANGHEIWFWRRSLYPPRKVSGFFTLADLERLAFQDRHRESLSGADVVTSIVDRDFQILAVKTVAERIAASRRKFLLVMATGTGKTRTAIALVELLLRLKWITRVLFLADRRELVKQALDAFKEHLPDVPRARIEGGDLEPGARIYGATYPSMMAAYPSLSPGHFDLIIADESHRSIYQRYKAIFDHFDALQLGLTATPTDFIDHNTFELFECPEGLPTFYYGYDEAVRDRVLVPYRILSARTEFQVEGLKPGELPPELAQAVADQGIDPGELSFEGTELEQRVTNTGTNDAIVREFMERSIKDALGTLPAKTIIFAVSHAHALRLYESFNRLHPDLQQRGLARIIDSHMERAEKTLDDFKHRDLPRVAISVDMLDTGIDVPAIRNLVFAKPVFSYVKFWQMIGRGTRRWRDPLSGQDKEDFLIIDHWANFEYFQVNREGREPGGVTEPLPARLFRLRLEKMQILFGRNLTAEAVATRASLQAMLGDLPPGNIHVAPHAEELSRFRTSADAWTPLDDAKVRHLSTVIAPLLRFSTATGYAVLQFECVCEQLALAHLKADPAEVEKLRQRVVENLELLPVELPEVRAQSALIDFALSDGFWSHLDYARIMSLSEKLAPLLRFRRSRESVSVIHLTLPDEITRRHWIIFGPAGEGAFAEAYRAQIEAAIRSLAEDTPALQKLRAGQELTDDELEAIARLLGGPDLFVTEEKLREAYELPEATFADFLRHALGLAKLRSREDQIAAAFDAWVAAHPRLNATQLMFVRTVRQALLSHARITTVAQLEEPPFSRIGEPRRLFTSDELNDILGLTTKLTA